MDIEENDTDGLEYPMCYEYLCCDDSLLKTHTLDEEIVMPECTSDDLNYYKLNKMYYDSEDSDKLLKVMRTSIKKKENYTIFKFKNSKLYKKGTKELLQYIIAQLYFSALGTANAREVYLAYMFYCMYFFVQLVNTRSTRKVVVEHG